MNTEVSAGLDAGEGDYFSAILAMQHAADHARALPVALSELIASLQMILETEGVQWHWPNPVLLSAGDLTGFGAAENVCVFQHRDSEVEWIIAGDHAAIIALATTLLGGKPALSQRAASRIESQIAQGFFKLMKPGFKQLDKTQSSVVWQDYAGAKLAFDEASASPFFVLMINRRSDTAVKPQSKAPDDEQKNHLRRALGQGVLNVDYVLEGGQVPLAVLRNLAAGTVLPLESLDHLNLEARANGKVVYRGLLKMSADRMKFVVKSVLAGTDHD